MWLQHEMISKQFLFLGLLKMHDMENIGLVPKKFHKPTKHNGYQLAISQLEYLLY